MSGKFIDVVPCPWLTEPDSKLVDGKLVFIDTEPTEQELEVWAQKVRDDFRVTEA